MRFTGLVLAMAMSGGCTTLAAALDNSTSNNPKQPVSESAGDRIKLSQAMEYFYSDSIEIPSNLLQHGLNELRGNLIDPPPRSLGGFSGNFQQYYSGRMVAAQPPVMKTTVFSFTNSTDEDIVITIDEIISSKPRRLTSYRLNQSKTVFVLMCQEAASVCYKARSSNAQWAGPCIPCGTTLQEYVLGSQ